MSEGKGWRIIINGAADGFDIETAARLAHTHARDYSGRASRKPVAWQVDAPEGVRWYTTDWTRGRAVVVECSKGEEE